MTESQPTPAALDAVLITEALARRPARAPDYEAENRALARLAEELAARPERLLQTLVELVVEVGHADSAGISIHVPGADGEDGIFRWDAVAGLFAPNLGGSMPRAQSPCGIVIDRDMPLLFDRPGRHFVALAGVEPPIVENLLVPFHVDGRAVGTLWAIGHTPARRFDAEDARLLLSLARFAAVGYQLTTALHAARAAHGELEERVAERTAALAATNAALRQGEARLQLALDAAELGTWTWELESGVGDLDARGAVIVGLVPGGPVNVAAAQLASIHPDDLARIEAEVAAGVGRGGAFRLAYRTIHPDGSIHHVLSHAHVVAGDAGHPARIVGTNRDVTAEREAEVSLRVSDARFRTLVQNLPDYAIFQLDPDGFITEWTEGAQRVKGYTADEVLGRHLAMFYPPEALAAGDPGRELAEAARAGRAEREQWRVRKGGERFWVNEIATAIHDADGGLVGFTKISRDLTERRRAEEALRASEERYRHIVEGARDYAIFTTDAAGRIDGWAAGAETIFGWSEPEALGRPFEITFTEEDRAAEVPAAELVTAAADGVAADVRWHARKDGGRVFIEGTTRALRDGQGRLTGYLKIGQDVTERRRLEAERERLAVAEAVAAERQAFLRRVVRAQEEERRHVSHEVHDSVTQLAAAAALRLDDLAERLAADLLAEDMRDLARARELARKAAAESRRLIAGLRPAALDDFGLAGAVGQEVAALRAEGWRATLADGDLAGVRLAPEVEITAYRVAQEALANVRKHTRPGVRVQVVLKRRDGALRLEVRDWGPGFDPQAVQASTPGERIGLTGMRERLALLGGDVAVRSRPGGGTTIRATLPLPEEA